MFEENKNALYEGVETEKAEVNTPEAVKSFKKVTEDTVRQAKARLEKYKTSRKSLDQRIIDNEQFWKMRHWEGKSSKENVNPTGWLLNAIHSKHADMMDGYPEPNIRAKEQADEREAKILSEIVPVILEGTGFKKTYSKVSRDKLNKGTGVYGIFWDSSKYFGMGDISIEKINPLNLFFEPEVENIQQSREVFLLKEISRDILQQKYPVLKDKTLSSGENVTKYQNDDSVDENDKVVVYDWYYKKWEGDICRLHYCKFVGETVIYASEDDTARASVPVIDPVTNTSVRDEFGNELTEEVGKSRAETGWYEHGLFPFVLDVMFPVEASPFGYGYTDLFKGTQEDIDLLNHSIVRNALLCSRARVFAKENGGVNIDDYTDLSKDVVTYEGMPDDIIPITPPQMPAMVVEIMNNKIEELKEVSGNRDVNNGSTSSGVTAASAIAALQEHAGKTSRDNLQNTYEAFKDITYQVIELIRQFYDTQRQFRIVGENGKEEYAVFSNANIKPQQLPSEFGVEYGYRVPQFDIVVSASKATAYSKLSQNEFALQMYQAGLFAPQNGDVALAAVKMMDFDDKDKVISMIEGNTTLFKQNQMLLQVAMGLAQKYEPAVAVQIAQTLGMEAPEGAAVPADIDADIKETNADGSVKTDEHGTVAKARERSQQSTQVG